MRIFPVLFAKVFLQQQKIATVLQRLSVKPETDLTLGRFVPGLRPRLHIFPYNASALMLIESLKVAGRIS